MRVWKIGRVEVHTPLQRDDGAVGGYTVAHVAVFGFGEVWEGAWKDGAPAEDLFHAGVDVLQI